MTKSITDPVPSVSVKYAANGSSTRANELGMRAMQERAYAKRQSGVMGQKVNIR
ncbi:hypothetical protein [Roseinatronobacter sp. NSM]|uniref:hypothetical protein n=1 Tax=Roseinatronobacter sp. NSM TaxID=3457785 RepID=UPI00403637B3